MIGPGLARAVHDGAMAFRGGACLCLRRRSTRFERPTRIGARREGELDLEGERVDHLVTRMDEGGLEGEACKMRDGGE